jgi:hypothetical protein
MKLFGLLSAAALCAGLVFTAPASARGHHHEGHHYGHRHFRPDFDGPRHRPRVHRAEPGGLLLPGLPSPPTLSLPKPSLPPLPHLPGLPHP